MPRSLNTHVLDDNNSTDPAAPELAISLQETVRFNALSGQTIHPGKVVGWALDPDLWDRVSALMLNGPRLRENALPSQARRQRRP